MRVHRDTCHASLLFYVLAEAHLGKERHFRGNLATSAQLRLESFSAFVPSSPPTARPEWIEMQYELYLMT